jgi:hypothetical protein
MIFELVSLLGWIELKKNWVVFDVNFKKIRLWGGLNLRFTVDSPVYVSPSYASHMKLSHLCEIFPVPWKRKPSKCLSHLFELYETLSFMRKFSGPFDRIYGRVDCIFFELQNKEKFRVTWKFQIQNLILCLVWKFWQKTEKPLTLTKNLQNLFFHTKKFLKHAKNPQKISKVAQNFPKI